MDPLAQRQGRDPQDKFKRTQKKKRKKKSPISKSFLKTVYSYYIVLTSPNGQIISNPYSLSLSPLSVDLVLSFQENQKPVFSIFFSLSANNSLSLSLSLSLCLVSQIQTFLFEFMANQTVKCSTPTKSTNYSISKVRVIVRVRPFLFHEISGKNDDPKPCISVLDQECEPSGEEVAVYLKDKDTR